LIATLQPAFQPGDAFSQADIERGLSQLSYRVDTISAATIDSSVASITCDANFYVDHVGTGSHKYPINYELRPNVEVENAFVLNVRAQEAASQASELASSAILEARASRLKGQERMGARASSATFHRTSGGTTLRYGARLLDPAICVEAAVSEGGWFRNEDGEIVVLVHGICRTAMGTERDAIADDEAFPNGE
jgi:hypothetical protein